MKRYFAKIFLGLGLCQAAMGGPSPIYQNYGVVTTPPVVDALAFYNAGIFNVETSFVLSATNIASSLNVFGLDNEIPFMTKDTLGFTNASSGVMIGTPGFRFDTGLSGSRHSASFFENDGFMQAIDVEAFPYLYSAVGATAGTVVSVPDASVPIPSQVLVLATNIVNTGSISVGNDGLIRLSGNNVTNAYASLGAGFIDTVGETNFEEDTTGVQGEDSAVLFDNGPYFYVSSTGVYDLFWGVTNALTVDVSGLELPFGIPNILDGAVNFGFGAPFIPSGFDASQYSVSAYFNINAGTNFYYNLVFVNTNLVGSNLSATVGFTQESFALQYASDTIPINDPAYEGIVQFSEPVFDVISGQTVTNGIYLIDDGAILPVMSLSINAGEPNNGPTFSFARPNPFEVTTVTPPQWFDTLPGNAFYDPAAIYTPNEFNNNKQPMEISEYGAQIGHNPGSLSGSFTSLATTASEGFLNFGDLQVNLPDPSNQPARIEINSGNADLTQARLRAEGLVIMNITNLVGGGTGGVDYGEANLTIGATNGSLMISNVIPATFQRVRGNIYALSASWQNLQTNTGGGDTNFPATNLWHYHVLVLDQNLFGSFPTSMRNLNLTGKSSVVLQDSLNVINQAVINTSNLTVSSTNFFSQNAANFSPAYTPNLKNLLISTNGILQAANVLDIGLDASQGQASPTGRKYTVNTITNFGRLIGAAPELQSAIFENDGDVIANSGGSMLIEANALGLGLAVTNATNFLFADGNIDLSAASIAATNSTINAGLAERGSLTLYATEQLTDFVSGTPTTNTNSVIINHWTVTGGFSLPVKPGTGDLFGTELHTIATNFGQVTHVWGAEDRGATAAGFVNNAVIGRLVLDLQSSNAVLRFSAAGPSSAMYVDYLELTNLAFKDYRTALLIDQNLTIYFAACNLDPEKLIQVYPQLKWVQNFAGPNSTQVVPYLNSTNVCLMNTNLANSFEISFFDGLPNAFNQPYVLNNPNDPTETYPCPGIETTLRSYLVGSPVPGGGQTYSLLNISVNGQGSITPELKISQMALGKNYTLTAKPAKGWVFQSWSPTIGLPGTVNANSPILPFNFVSNTLITANFVPNPFGAVQGVYNGLFFETAAVNPASSGAFTLKLSPSGSFSGRLLMASGAYSFSSQFSGAGGALVQARSGAHSLTLNLQLDMTGQTGQILGDVNGGAWDAPLAADIAPVWTTKNPSPLAGSYTMVLPWESGGDSYGAGSVNKLGVLTIAGALADGAPFSVSAPVSQDGQWPFYAYSAVAKDSVLGWMSVSNGLAGTNISWSKAAGKGPLYPGGFTSVLQVVASPWEAPARKTSALTLTNPVVSLSGGGLPEPLNINVALKNYLSYTATNLNLTINASTGSFSGWFDNPGTKKKLTVSGVVLQNAGNARGFFQGTNESGTLLLQEQPGQQDQ